MVYMKAIHLNQSANGKTMSNVTIVLVLEESHFDVIAPMNIMGIAVKKKFLKQYTSVKYLGTL